MPARRFRPSEHSLYREYSRHVWSTVRGVVPTIEQTGIDEGYLDVGEVAADFLEARIVAEAVQTSVRGATSLTCSLGVAPCKVVAKVGSDARKPGGLVVVVPGQEAGFLAPLDVRKLPGVGPKAEERLRAAGVDTVGALAALSDDGLRRLLREASAGCCAIVRAESIRVGSSSSPSAFRSASRTRSSEISSSASSCTKSCAGWRARSPITCRRRARPRAR